MTVEKISFGEWQVNRFCIINAGFDILGLVHFEHIKLEGHDELFERYGLCSGYKEFFRVVKVTENFEIIVINDKSDFEFKNKKFFSSDFVNYFSEKYSTEKRQEELQRFEYQKLNLQIGNFLDVKININNKIYELIPLTKSETKWQILEKDSQGNLIDQYAFKGLGAYGGILHNHYVVIYDDIDQYYQTTRENFGYSNMLIIK